MKVVPLCYGTDMTNSVVERMGTTESVSLILKREDGGKIRVTSQLWPEAKVILKGEVLEVRNVDGRLHSGRKVKTTTSGTHRKSVTVT
jgi:hypothetical protein